MLVFLSWSGARSKALAEFMAGWLGDVVHALDAWVSADIQKGARWALEISDKIEQCRAGIIVLTPENQRAPWLLFEAGAISKIREATVCTLLMGLDPQAVDEPLSQFQSTKLDKNDVRRLLRDLNTLLQESGDRALPEERLNRAFENNWPRLSKYAQGIVAKSPPPEEAERARASAPLSLLVAAPGRLGFDITRITWDHDKCWLVSEHFQERIKLIPSRVGPTFRVHRAEELLSRLGATDYAELKLTDNKGNEWIVKPFYPFENVLPLSAVAPVDKLLRDYGEADE